MKDGTTHLAYKVEHGVDVESEKIVASPYVKSRSMTVPRRLEQAQINLVRGGSDTEVSEVLTDKGYLVNDTLEECEELDVRTYISDNVQVGSDDRQSRCLIYRAHILSKLDLGLTAQRIFQDLQSEQGFAGCYHNVLRFVRRLQS